MPIEGFAKTTCDPDGRARMFFGKRPEPPPPVLARLGFWIRGCWYEIASEFPPPCFRRVAKRPACVDSM